MKLVNKINKGKKKTLKVEISFNKKFNYYQIKTNDFKANSFGSYTNINDYAWNGYIHSYTNYNEIQDLIYGWGTIPIKRKYDDNIHKIYCHTSSYEYIINCIRWIIERIEYNIEIYIDEQSMLDTYLYNAYIGQKFLYCKHNKDEYNGNVWQKCNVIKDIKKQDIQDENFFINREQIVQWYDKNEIIDEDADNPDEYVRLWTGEMYHIDNTIYDNYHGIYCSDDDIVYYIYGDDVVVFDKLQDTYPDFVYCVDTDEYHWSDDVYYCEYDDNYYYDESEMPEDEEKYIYEYHSDMENFTTDDDTTKGKQFGLEIELEFDDFPDDYELEKLCEFKEDNTQFILERDGSLSNGFELITRPFRFKNEDSLDFIKPALEYIDNKLDVNNCIHCGGHVHIDRDEFVNDLSMKLLGFIISRDWEQSLEWSKRDENNISQVNNYAAKIKEYSNDKEEYVFRKLENYNINGMNRYNCVNYNKDNTVEIRIFKTAYKINELTQRLTEVSNLIDCCNKLGTILECTDIEDVAGLIDDIKLNDMIYNNNIEDKINKIKELI